MPTSNRSEITNKNKFPGPGKYFHIPKSNAPSFSLRGRSKDQVFNNNPKLGPGLYDPNYSTILEKTPAYKLGTSRRNSSLASSNIVPGPGNYTPKIEDDSFVHHFGNTARSVSYDNNLPGPGAYEINSALSPVSFSITPRRSALSTYITPGPGTYSAKKSFFCPNYSVSKSPRKLILQDNHIPGPGSYSLANNDYGKKLTYMLIRIPHAVRETLEKPKQVPGPGEYSPNHQPTKLSFSLRSRPAEIAHDIVPGPGKYNPNQDFVLESSPNFAIGKSSKSKGGAMETHNKNNPGPDAYFTKSTLSGPKCCFGSSSRSEWKKDEVPGPGSYTLN